MEPEYQGVSSSNVASVAFDQGFLFVKFHVKRKGRIVGTRTYRYEGVPVEVYQAFLAAPSKGTFHHENIKGRYDFVPM